MYVRATCFLLVVNFASEGIKGEVIYKLKVFLEKLNVAQLVKKFPARGIASVKSTAAFGVRTQYFVLRV
jgi:hypothetical protein